MVLTQTPRLRTLLASLALSSSVSAQNLLGSAPACAQTCDVLTAAQQSCESTQSGAPLTTIAACFCTTSTTTNLRTDGSVCASSCTTSEEQTNAMNWFASFCAEPQTITALAGTQATATAATNNGNAAAATTTGASATNTGINDNSANAAITDNGSWWNHHARWIAMVIVLVVAFTLILIIGICLKKRATRKRNARNSLPPSAVWGPQQSHPSVDKLGASSSRLDMRDAEKGGHTVGGPAYGQPQVVRVQSDMSGALQRGSLRGDAATPSSGIARQRSPMGKGKRLKKLVGR